jgi:hypothetical protein
MFTGTRFGPDHTVYFSPSPFQPPMIILTPSCLKSKPLLPKRHRQRSLQPDPRRQRLVHAPRARVERHLLDLQLQLDQRGQLWVCAGYYY